MHAAKLDHHARGRNIKFLADKRGQPGGYSLAHFITGTVEDDLIVWRYLQECAGTTLPDSRLIGHAADPPVNDTPTTRPAPTMPPVHKNFRRVSFSALMKAPSLGY